MAERAAAAGQHDPDTDLYALLHVSRDATEDDIKHAYRQWAQIYHPDKYQTVQMQDVATHHFQRIRFAYDVLSDEQKRQIYDIYGVEGLSSGLELGPHLRTHDDIRADFERTQKRKDVIRAAQHTNQTATLVVNVSAADMLRRFDCGPRITGFQMSSQVQAGLSDCDTVVLGGSMYARRGLGGGTALAMFRRQVSPEASWEVVGTAGLSNTLGFNTTRQLTSHVTATSGVTWHAAKGTFALNNSWSRQLSEGTTGTINLHTGEDPGVSVGWQSNGAKNSAGGDLKVGDGTFGLQGNFVRRFSAKSSGRVAARFGTGGVDVELGATRRISEHSSTGMSCVVGLQGVLWKIRYTRGSQKFIIPIVLSTTLRPAILLPALLLPPSIYALLRRYVLKPYGLRRKQRKELAARRANAETLFGLLGGALYCVRPPKCKMSIHTLSRHNHAQEQINALPVWVVGRLCMVEKRGQPFNSKALCLRPEEQKTERELAGRQAGRKTPPPPPPPSAFRVRNVVVWNMVDFAFLAGNVPAPLQPLRRSHFAFICCCCGPCQRFKQHRER